LRKTYEKQTAEIGALSFGCS